MADFTSGFWSIFIAAVTILSIVVLTWFLWAQSRVRTSKDDGGSETSGHTWDEDLKEFNNPMPRWWLNLFYLTLIWGTGYLIAYPGLGAFEGVLEWSQESQYEAEVATANETYGPLFSRYAGTPIEQLVDDSDAMAMGRNLFSSYCTQCHGSDAGGARGFPDLTDADWQWGNSPEQIEHTILNGRQGVMPPWVEVIGEDGVNHVTTYVEQLAGRNVTNREHAAAGKKVYDQLCIACHGADGAGNALLGAPRLTDDIWLYGGTHRRIAESIANGREGVMPANENFLGKDKVHVLAAYVYGFTRGDAPTK